MGVEPPRRSFRDRIDDHPLGLFVTVAIAAVTATLTIVVPLMQVTTDNRASALEAQMEQQRLELQAALERERSSRIAEVAALEGRLQEAQASAERLVAEERSRAQAQVDELTRSLSSIRRSLGSGSEYFDVASLVVDQDAAATLPADSRYFPADRWYALDPEAHPDWTYEVTSELRMTAELLGMTEDELRAQQSESQVEAATRFPVHLWRYGGDRVVTFTDPGSGQTMTIHPRTQVSVQRVTIDEYLGLMGEMSGATEDQLAVLARTLRRDPAGWVLQDNLGLEIGSSAALRARIETLQKRDQIAYARVETTLPGATMDGGPEGEVYWSREWLIVSAGEDLFLVKLYVADDDRRAPDYAAVGTWLDLFRILAV
jgi:hypothetical protein